MKMENLHCLYFLCAMLLCLRFLLTPLFSCTPIIFSRTSKPIHPIIHFLSLIFLYLCILESLYCMEHIPQRLNCSREIQGFLTAETAHTDVQKYSILLFGLWSCTQLLGCQTGRQSRRRGSTISWI